MKGYYEITDGIYYYTVSPSLSDGARTSSACSLIEVKKIKKITRVKFSRCLSNLVYKRCFLGFDFFFFLFVVPGQSWEKKKRWCWA